MRQLARIATAAAVWGALTGLALAQAPPAGAPATNPPRKKQATNKTQGQLPQAPRTATAPAAVPPGQAQPAAPQTRAAYRPTQYVAPSYPSNTQAYFGTEASHFHPSNRSVVRQYPHYTSEYTYGYRNPGGVGRYSEYYPPNDQFQNGGRDPVAHPGFDQNIPVGSISEQAMATSVGVSRYNAMQQHMDNFARPMGYGFGFGMW